SSHWVAAGPPTAGEFGPGCGLRCLYCNQREINTGESGGKEGGYLSPQVDAGISINSRLMIGKQIAKYVPLDRIVAALTQYRYYKPTSTVLLENFNDPGVDWTTTLELMKRLFGGIGHTGPMILITKMGIPKKYVQEIYSLQERGAKPMCFVTYSGLPYSIEPMDPHVRITTMRRFHDAGLPVVLAMRPLIEGLNATEGCIKRTLGQAVPFISAVAIGGLFVYHPYTIEAFNRAGHTLPTSYIGVDYSVAKTLPESIRALVRYVAAAMGVRVPIHDHTSCAVAHVMTTVYSRPTADRLAHWAGSETPQFQSYCAAFCDQRQIAVCMARSSQGSEVAIGLAKEELRRITYASYDVIPSVTQAGLLLVVGASLLADQLFCLEEACGWDVNNLPSFEGLVHRSRQALEEGLNVQFDSVFVDAFLVGQELHVFLDGVVDGMRNELAVRWLRGKNRARIQVVDAHSLCDDRAGRLAEVQLIEKSHGLQSPEAITSFLRQVVATVRERHRSVSTYGDTPLLED
ncbi:MAG: hypothetical protein WBP52_06870, partial [Terriglobales bacterium]